MKYLVTGGSGFIGSNFVPYHDGLSLFAKINGEEQQIRLQGSPGEQATVIEDLNQIFYNFQRQLMIADHKH